MAALQAFLFLQMILPPTLKEDEAVKQEPHPEQNLISPKL
jgi:hypothetical protein